MPAEVASRRSRLGHGTRSARRSRAAGRGPTEEQQHDLQREVHGPEREHERHQRAQAEAVT